MRLTAQQERIMGQWIMKQVIQKTAPSSSPETSYAHGPGGLFSHPALENPLYSAVITPWTGLQYVLPFRGTTKTDPLYGVVTGVTSGSGNNPNGVCDDPPTAGLAKLCMAWYPLGRFSLQTSVYDVSRGDRVTDRGEHTDFILVGSPAGMDGNPMVPGGGLLSDVDLSESSKKMIEWMVEWSRRFARVLYTGNPTNNTGGGGYKEPNGLDIIINTGHNDAETNTDCPARDSIVQSFGNINVTSGTAQNRSDLVRLTSYVFRNLQQNAGQMNLYPCQWVISMPFSMFYELTEFWPIAFATYRNSLIPTGSTNFVDANAMEVMRTDMRGDLIMRRGQYLLIDGQRVPVVIDDAITETTQVNGAFSSNMYFVPLTVVGRPATFIEYLDYDGIGALRNANRFAPADSYETSDNGRFLLHKKPPTNFCTQVLGLTEWRVVCVVPQLAARITNIAYTPLMHERSGFPTSPYFADGGRTGRPGSPSYFPPT
jgi:hypothetical protein